MAIPKMTTDPYAVLGIPNDAAPAAIRSSYKKLILQCHPDKVHDESLREEKANQFQKVQEAYELLIDSRRRRKYDEELVKQAKAQAEAQAKPPTTHAHSHPHSPHSHPHGTRSASGPVPGSAERTERPGRRERSGTNPSSDEQQQRDKDKEREARHARRRATGERKSREESSWSTEEREARKAQQAAYREQEAYEQAQAQARYQEEQSTPRHSRSYRYQEESPRKSSYDPRQSHEIPKVPPPAPPPPTQPDVRPGYVEAKAAEQSKLEKLRQRMAEETISVPRPGATDDLRQTAAAAAELLEKARVEAARMERERDRESMRGSRDRDRGTDIPHHRERKTSKSPPLRRGSSVASKCDEVPSTPIMRQQHVYGTSAPPHPSFTTSHLHADSYVGPRRRHSSPGIEKQTSRMPPREGPTDSGYSSPSTDTPPTDKKMPSPELRTSAEGIDPRTGNWKKYTFEVYVREDAEAQAQAKGGIPSHHARRKTGSTSPSLHPLDPLSPPLLPAEYISKAMHGIPFAYPTSVDPRYAPPPSSIHHSPPSSHHPHSPHTSPGRTHRHHHHHSPNHSPRLGSEQFSPPGLTRANTSYHPQSSRSREREHSYGGYAPSLSRNPTFPG